MTTVGHYLRRARLNANMSQPQLAQVTGFSQSKVSRMETSTRGVSVSDISLWMDVTCADPMWRAEAIRLTDVVPANQRTFKLSNDALVALSDLSNHRNGSVTNDQLVSDALVFTRDTIVRLGSWRTYPEESR